MRLRLRILHSCAKIFRYSSMLFFFGHSRCVKNGFTRVYGTSIRFSRRISIGSRSCLYPRSSSLIRRDATAKSNVCDAELRKLQHRDAVLHYRYTGWPRKRRDSHPLPHGTPADFATRLLTRSGRSGSRGSFELLPCYVA